MQWTHGRSASPSIWFVCYLFLYPRSADLYPLFFRTIAIAQFAISCKLHQINSPWLADAPPSILGPPKDALELGQRIMIFWTVFEVDKTVSLSSGFPATLVDHVCTIPIYPKIFRSKPCIFTGDNDDVARSYRSLHNRTSYRLLLFTQHLEINSSVNNRAVLPLRNTPASVPCSMKETPLWTLVPTSLSH